MRRLAALADMVKPLNALGGAQINDFGGVVAQRCDEKAFAINIDAEMVDTTTHIGQ